jgi:hypothetical protein
MGLEQAGNETAGEVPSGNTGQAPATGVAPSQTPQSGASSAPAPWKARIGDTEYDESTWKTKGVEDFRKFHGEYTRTRQESARLRDESAAGMELLQMVQGDPQLLAEVRRRMNAGQSQEQAVNQAVQNDPRVDSLAKEVDAMKQDKASAAFRAKHPDLSPDDEQGVIGWIEKYTEKLKGAGWSYDEILEQAYVNVAHQNSSKKAADALVQGQQMKEQEIQKGRKSQLLGAPAPTAQTSGKAKKSLLHASPAQRQEIAMERFQANKRKG